MRPPSYGSNYGEAGAIDLLGRREEPRLPPAISRQNTYWLWGTHGCTGRVMISITGAPLKDIQDSYNSVQIVGTLDNPYATPFEHRNVYLLRDRKASLQQDWPDFKNYF